MNNETETKILLEMPFIKIKWWQWRKRYYKAVIEWTILVKRIKHHDYEKALKYFEKRIDVR